MHERSVLITGVAGLIGSNLADWIIDNKSDINIIGIDDLSGGYIENINENIIFYEKNIVDDDIEFIFKKHKIDIVFHFAAYAAEGLSPFMRVFNYNNNLIASTRLITYSIKYDIRRFVFTSSMATYGKGNAPFDEKDTLKPIDPYGVAKFACEMDLQVAGEQHGLDWCIIKPHNCYGPKQNIWDKYRNVLGIWMNKIMNGEPISIFGDGKQKRAFSFINDCTSPLWQAAYLEGASKQIINLGGTKEISIEGAADILINVTGQGEKVFYKKRHEVKNAWSTWEKSVNILGYEDRTSLYDGLTVMWEWAKTQPKRIVKSWDNYELEKGIYDYWK